MPKRSITFKTSSRVTGNIKPSVRSALALFTALVLSAQTPAPAPLSRILQSYSAARAALDLHDARTSETIGVVSGLGQHGSFHVWDAGTRSRRDDVLGARTERQLRLDDRIFVQNDDGDVRELHGLLARRQVTEDAIDSGAFASHPENVTDLGPGTLEDGRAVERLRIAPPLGEPYTIALDATTWFVDEKSYVDGDGTQTIDYRDYRVVNGMLMPFVEVVSDGDHAYDITSHVTDVRVDRPIDDAVFAPFHAATINAVSPRTVSLHESSGLYFVQASIHGHALTFLLDSGSQGIVLDPNAVKTLGLIPEGSLEIFGANRTQGHGFVPLDAIEIGGARLPVGDASVVELHDIVVDGRSVDGILGYPLFAAASVRIDPDTLTMTLARPGTVSDAGERIDVDTDRELPEVNATVERVPVRVLVDTGDSGELLIFQSFVEAHPGVVDAGHERLHNLGIGGTDASVSAAVSAFGIGSYQLFNRSAQEILARTGAFADRTDGGNVGLGTLKNFVMTFDLTNNAIYLKRARSFDDGRYRQTIEPSSFDSHR